MIYTRKIFTGVYIYKYAGQVWRANNFELDRSCQIFTDPESQATFKKHCLIQWISMYSPAPLVRNCSPHVCRAWGTRLCVRVYAYVCIYAVVLKWLTQAFHLDWHAKNDKNNPTVHHLKVKWKCNVYINLCGSFQLVIRFINNDNINYVRKAYFSVHQNTFIPGQNGRHFANDIFRCIFVKDKFCISIRTSPKFVPEGPTDWQ